jgi:hypothetical protein
MIKLAIKLAIAALLANALYHIGSEYLTFVRFRDAVRATAMYRARDDDDLRRRVVALASQYDVPLAGADLAIARQANVVSVSGSYHKPIEILPQYPVSWPFDLSLEVPVSTAVPLPGAPPR